jgi:hypothetical protein
MHNAITSPDICKAEVLAKQLHGRAVSKIRALELCLYMAGAKKSRKHLQNMRALYIP